MTDNSIALRVAATLAFEELGLLNVGTAIDTPSAPDALPAAVSVAFDGAHAGCLTLPRVGRRLPRARREHARRGRR